MQNRFLLLSAWLILVLSILSMIFNLSVNSDSLILAEVSRNLFSLGGIWQNWRFNGSPAYFLEMPLYFLGYKIFPYLMDNSLFVTLMEAILITVSSLWLAKIVKPNLSDRAKVMLILLVSFVSLTSVNSGLLMYFGKSNYHVSSLVFSLLSLGCLIQYLTTTQRFYGILLIVWATLSIPSDMIYLISFYLTAVVVLLVLLGYISLFYKHDFLSFKVSLIKSLSFLGVGLLLGKFLDFVIVYNVSIFGVTLNAVGISLTQTMQTTYRSFKFDNAYTFIFAWLVVIALIYLIILFFKSLRVNSQHQGIQQETNEMVIGFNIKTLEDYKIGFVGLFLIFLLPINMGCLIFASHGDLDVYRYYMFPLSLIFIQATLNLDRSPLLRRKLSIVFLWLILIIFSIIIVLTAVKNLKNNSLSSFRQGMQSQSGNDILGVTHCLEQLDGNPISLHSGIAGYWHARAVTLFLKKHNYILNVLGFGDVHPAFWIATKDPLLHPNKYQVYYNFVIVIKDPILGPATYDFTPSTLSKILPRPYTSYVCSTDPRFEIWVYKGSELNDLMQANISQFLFDQHETKQVNWLGIQLPGKVGQVVGNARIANSKNDQAGYLTLGPSFSSTKKGAAPFTISNTTGFYIPSFSLDKGISIPSLVLKKSNYKISIHYSANEVKINQASGGWEIGKFADVARPIIFAHGEFPPRNNSTIKVLLEIFQKKMENIEIRTWFSGHGGLKIYSISIEKLT